MAGIGVNFAPTQTNVQAGQGTAGKPGGPQSKLQEAIKVLSLRLPKVLGAQALAPGPLLTGPGSGGMNPDKALAMNLQQQLPAPLAATQATPAYTPPPISAGPSAAPAPPPPAPVFSGGSGGTTPAQQAVQAIASSPSFAPVPHFTPGLGAPGTPVQTPTPSAETKAPPPPRVQIPTKGPVPAPRQDWPPAPQAPQSAAPSPQTAPEPPPPIQDSASLINERLGTETDLATLQELLRLAQQNQYGDNPA